MTAEWNSVRAEPVEAPSFSFSESWEEEGFDQLSPNGFPGSEASA
jgi:hypothetical protein